jgi:hypothetical protein
MNDSSELVVLLTALMNYSPPDPITAAEDVLPGHAFGSARLAAFRTDYIDTLKRQFHDGGFIGALCFSEANDDLSQWRGYTRVGQGVCLRFNTERLRMIAKLNGMHDFTECHYVDNPEAIYVEAINKLLLDVDQAIHSDYAQIIATIDSPTLFITAAKYKSDKFSGEREWRLISPQLGCGWDRDISHMRRDEPDENVPVCFRTGRYSLIPYVQFPWTNASADITSAIDGVVVGPTPEPELAQRAVKYALRAHGLDCWENVKVSPIPFREI